MKRDVCDQVKLSFFISNETLGSNLISQFLSFLFFLKYLFIYLVSEASVSAHRIFVGSCRIFCCGIGIHSLVVAHGLSCSVACGILDPQPEVEPVSSVLQGGFLTSGPSGKSQFPHLKMRIV